MTEPGTLPWLKYQWRRSGASTLAWTGTLLLHLALIAGLWTQAQVSDVPTRPRAMDVVFFEFEPAPQPAPALAPATPETTVPRPQPTRPTVVAVAPPESVPELPDPTTARVAAPHDWHLDAERTAPETPGSEGRPSRPFAGRSIDAMLPGAARPGQPTLPMRSGSDFARIARSAGQMLGNLPSAASNPDAVADLLIEGWEAKHHASDLAACELQYQQFDAAMRRRLCGG